MHDQWRQAGIDARLELMPPAQMQVGEVRDTFRAFQTAVTGNTPDTPLVKFLTERISGPENRWVGSNRGGYRNPEYDRLYSVYSTSLDRAERDRTVVEMVRLVNSEVAGIPLYYNFSVLAHAASVKGPLAGRGLGSVHEWQLKS
jgi:ABC-type transport system substrate-binding protein